MPKRETSITCISLKKKVLKCGIISQARMTSTRLPGKVLLKTAGKTVLEHHISRLRWSGVPIYLATTINRSDDVIADHAAELSIPVYRGDENNVLQRFHQCAEKYELDVIIRVTSDCPLIDGFIVADGLRQYLEIGDKKAYLSNVLVRTFPRGLDFEIFSYDLLSEAHRHARTESDKEHVTPYIIQNRPAESLHHYKGAEDNSDLRWTLDTDADWQLISTLFDVHRAGELPYGSILEVIQQNPDLKNLNNHIQQKKINP